MTGHASSTRPPPQTYGRWAIRLAIACALYTVAEYSLWVPIFFAVGPVGWLAVVSCGGVFGLVVVGFGITSWAKEGHSRNASTSIILGALCVVAASYLWWEMLLAPPWAVGPQMF